MKRGFAWIAVLAATAAAAQTRNNDTLASADLLDFGVPIATSIGKADFSEDVDCFRMDLDGRARVAITTSSSRRMDVEGKLYDRNGTLVAEDSDSGRNANFHIARTLASGTWYVCVTGYDNRYGSYSIEARIVDHGRDADDHGDTPEASTLLRASAHGQANSSTDIDTFRIDVPQSALVRLHTSGQYDTVGELYNDRGDMLATDDDSGLDLNFDLRMQLAPGVYYLAVRGYSPLLLGSYTVHRADTADCAVQQAPAAP